MTDQEAKSAFDQLKAQGMSDDDLLGGLYLMFKNGDIDVDQLGSLVGILGYALTDEFKAMSPEDQKTKRLSPAEQPKEGVTPSEVDEAKKDPNGEQPPKAKEGAEAPKGEDGEEAKAPAEQPKEGEGSDDSEDEKKAMHLYGLDK